jgi:hypothetical protein
VTMAGRAGRNEAMEVSSQTMSVRPKLLAALLFTRAAAVMWLGTCVGLRLSDNVHVVESGLALRSGLAPSV